MDFSTDYENTSDLITDIWKRIDLPSLSINELIFKFSFELFILTPEDAENLIIKAINKGLLIKNENKTISLSHDLQKKIDEWQQERKTEINKNIQLHKKAKNIIEDVNKDKSSDFNTLLKAFLDKGTINRAVTLSDKDFSLKQKDLELGKIIAEVLGSKEKSYYIKIDLNQKILYHNCHDFESRRAKNKKFCKHLAKFFLLLKEQDETLAKKCIESLAEDINDWEFSI